MLFDYHVHSNVSDGSLSPEELVAHAVKIGVGTLALCDHDTTAGIRRFAAAAQKAGVHGIGGIEVSATWTNGNCHLLGLGVRDDDSPLETVLREIRAGRSGRNVRILEKLAALGVNVSLIEAQALAAGVEPSSQAPPTVMGEEEPGGVLGRPHIAQVMVRKKYVSSVKEAFGTYLAKGGPAYVERHRLDPPDAVRLLHQAGGMPVLAHPSQLKLNFRELDAFVKNLMPHGLAGIEAFTPYASDEEIVAFRDIAKTHGLFVTGGSDFHGASKPDHVMGYYRPGVGIPEMGRRGINHEGTRRRTKGFGKEG